jgi:DNA topoisomerase-1
MEIKLGRNGKFLSCSRYPECDGALTLDGHEFKKDEPIGNDPTTGLPIFVLNGRFGPYVQLGMKVFKEKKKRVKKVKEAKTPSSASPLRNASEERSKATETEKKGKKTKKGARHVLSAEIKTDQSLVEFKNVETTTADPSTPASETTSPATKPKMASIPRGTDPSTVTIKDALKYLSLPRTLGVDPKTGTNVVASAGRFGPYIVRDGEYRTIKAPDNVYDIDLKRALEMLAIPKKARGFKKKER